MSDPILAELILNVVFLALFYVAVAAPLATLYLRVIHRLCVTRKP